MQLRELILLSGVTSSTAQLAALVMFVWGLIATLFGYYRVKGERLGKAPARKAGLIVLAAPPVAFALHAIFHSALDWGGSGGVAPAKLVEENIGITVIYGLIILLGLFYARSYARRQIRGKEK